MQLKNILKLKYHNKLFLLRWVPVITLLIIISVLLVIWYRSFPEQAWINTPNYLKMYFDYILFHPDDAFLRIETGPTGRQSWFVMPIYFGIIALISAYSIGKLKQEKYVVMNTIYIIYIIILGLFTITFQNASQYYNWYWNPELNTPGFVDTWTHITSPWLIAALVSPLSLERFFQWKRRSMWFFVFAVNVISALGWEIAESSASWDPSAGYFNFPLDSIKDLILGAIIATIIGTWIYERIVMDSQEKFTKNLE